MIQPVWTVELEESLRDACSKGSYDQGKVCVKIGPWPVSQCLEISAGTGW
jgi:hypothetical protein